MRKTKIIATVGPSCSDSDTLRNMIRAGADIFRLNFSHAGYEECLTCINSIRQIALKEDKNIAILLDTKGPEIRTGDLEEPVQLNAGDRFTLTTEEITGNKDKVAVNYEKLPEDVFPGDKILLDDGLIALEVLECTDKEVVCEVKNTQKLESKKGVNIPSTGISLPAVTEQDKRDIVFGVHNDLDFVAVSMVRKPEDIFYVRKIIEEEKGKDLDIIAKIENNEAVENIGEIIKAADGIMVARGDLGVEIPAERVPLVQKNIIDKCNQAGKPVITATQMLESMIDNPRPTRAEASDVANAILDGTDSLMLSGETAAGRYPVEAVDTMAKIALTTEQSFDYSNLFLREEDVKTHTVTDAISYSTCKIAQDLNVSAIITTTKSGYTSKMVRKYKPKAPVIAVTPHINVLRKMSLLWGVKALLKPKSEDTDRMFLNAVDVSLEAGLIKPGDLTVITAGVPAGVQSTTNLLKVFTVGEVLAQGTGAGEHAVTGVVRIIDYPGQAGEKIQKGDVLVTKLTDKRFNPVVEKVSAIITEEGGLSSHAAIMGWEYKIPVIVNANEVTRTLSDGQTVTVDSKRGLIYEGTARVL